MPEEAIGLFTPEGERRWVPDRRPEYHSDARDEVGAVWSTEVGHTESGVEVLREFADGFTSMIHEWRSATSAVLAGQA